MSAWGYKNFENDAAQVTRILSLQNNSLKKKQRADNIQPWFQVLDDLGRRITSRVL